MALIDSDLIKSVVRTRMEKMNKDESEVKLENAAYAGITVEFMDIVDSKVESYTAKIKELEAQQNGSVVNSDLIEYYRDRLDSLKQRLH